MRGMHLVALCAAILFYPGLPSQADNVFRCTDASGHVTFTQHGCSAAEQEHRQRAHNSPPGSTQPSAVKRQSASEGRKNSELIVVGQQDVACGNLLSRSERRQAIIRREIRRGMSRTDVESSLGKPDKVTVSNGVQRYHYREKRKGGANRQISFDEAGCVKGK